MNFDSINELNIFRKLLKLDMDMFWPCLVHDEHSRTHILNFLDTQLLQSATMKSYFPSEPFLLQHERLTKVGVHGHVDSVQYREQENRYLFLLMNKLLRFCPMENCFMTEKEFVTKCVFLQIITTKRLALTIQLFGSENTEALRDLFSIWRTNAPFLFCSSIIPDRPLGSTAHTPNQDIDYRQESLESIFKKSLKLAEYLSRKLPSFLYAKSKGKSIVRQVETKKEMFSANSNSTTSHNHFNSPVSSIQPKFSNYLHILEESLMIIASFITVFQFSDGFSLQGSLLMDDLLDTFEFLSDTMNHIQSSKGIEREGQDSNLMETQRFQEYQRQELLLNQIKKTKLAILILSKLYLDRLIEEFLDSLNLENRKMEISEHDRSNMIQDCIGNIIHHVSKWIRESSQVDYSKLKEARILGQSIFVLDFDVIFDLHASLMHISSFLKNEKFIQSTYSQKSLNGDTMKQNAADQLDYLIMSLENMLVYSGIEDMKRLFKKYCPGIARSSHKLSPKEQIACKVAASDTFGTAEDLLKDKIQQVKSVLGDVSEDLIRKYLLVFGENVETAIMAILENLPLPDHLVQQKETDVRSEFIQGHSSTPLSSQNQRQYNSDHEADPEAFSRSAEKNPLSSRKNVFDHDEFDIFNHSDPTQIPRDRIIYGKKQDIPHVTKNLSEMNSESLFQSKEELEEFKRKQKSIASSAAIWDDDEDEYDDTYDDRDLYFVKTDDHKLVEDETDDLTQAKIAVDKDDAQLDRNARKETNLFVGDSFDPVEERLVQLATSQSHLFDVSERKTNQRSQVLKELGWTNEQFEGWYKMFQRNPKKNKLMQKYEWRGNKSGATNRFVSSKSTHDSKPFSSISSSQPRDMNASSSSNTKRIHIEYKTRKGHDKQTSQSSFSLSLNNSQTELNESERSSKDNQGNVTKQDNQEFPSQKPTSNQFSKKNRKTAHFQKMNKMMNSS